MNPNVRVSGDGSRYSSLATRLYDGLPERIIYNMEKACQKAYHTTAEYTRRVGHAITDPLVSAWNARRGDATLLNYDSLLDKVYSGLQDVCNNASESMDFIKRYLGLEAYSTVRSRKHTRPGYGRDGFTLIELLTVTAITTLLVAILIPALYRVKKQARAVGCQSNLRQWATVFAANEVGTPGCSFSTASWLGAFNPDNSKAYGISPKVSFCPEATTPGYEPIDQSVIGPSSPEGCEGSTFSAWRRGDATGSYGLNSSFFSYHYKGSKILYNNASRVPVILGSATPWGGFSDPKNPPPSKKDGPIWDAPDNDPGVRHCLDRHNGNVNSSFLDSSVRPVGLKELWTLKWNYWFDTVGPWTKAGRKQLVDPPDWPQWMRKFKDY